MIYYSNETQSLRGLPFNEEFECRLLLTYIINFPEQTFFQLAAEKDSLIKWELLFLGS